MTTAAILDSTRGIHIFDHWQGVAAGAPLIERRMARIVMTAAANLRGQFGPRHDQRITGIGGMLGRRTMTVLALDAGQVRCLGLSDESRWQIESHRVAGQTRRVGLAAVSGEQRVGEGGRMEGMDLRFQNRGMASRAGFRAGVSGRGAGHLKESIAVTGRDGGRAEPVIVSGQRPPGGIIRAGTFIQPVITRRSIPCHLHAVGEKRNRRDEVRLARHPTGHGATQMNLLRAGRESSHESNCDRQQKRGCPKMDNRQSGAVGLANPFGIDARVEGWQHTVGAAASRRRFLELLQRGDLKLGVRPNLLQFGRSIRLDLPQLLRCRLLAGRGLIALRLDESLLGILRLRFHFLHRLFELGQLGIAQNLRAVLQGNGLQIGNRTSDGSQGGGVGPRQRVLRRFGFRGAANGAGEIGFQAGSHSGASWERDSF